MTLSYEPSDISTFDDGHQGTLDYANLFSNCTTRAADYSYPQPACESSTNWLDSPSCNSQIDSLASLDSFDQLHCYPYLDYPSGLQAVDPAWSTCVDTNYGGHFASVFDPPHALTPAPALGPVPTKSPSPPGAAPASHATDPAPVRTAAPKGTGPVDGASNHLPTDENPPVVNDPPVGSDTPSEDDPRVGNDPSADTDQFTRSASPVGSFQTSKGGSDPMIGFLSAAPEADHAASSELSIEHHPAGILKPIATVIQGHVIQAVPSSSGGVLFDGQFITPGSGSTSISGTPIALKANGDLVLGSKTFPNIIPNPLPTPESIIKVDSQTFTFSSNIILGPSHTLKPNDPVIGIDSTIVSLGQPELQVGSNIIAFAPDEPTLPAIVITAAGQLATLLPSGVVIAGTTLTSNAPAITVAGTRISLGGNGLAIGSSTISIPSPTPGLNIKIANQIYAISQITDGLVIAGQTLQVGQPAITISGNAIALENAGLIINGTSTVLFPSTHGAQPTPNDIGDFIFAGLNGGPAAEPSPVGAMSSKQTQQNRTGAAAGGVETFFGQGSTNHVQRIAMLAQILAIMLLSRLLY